MLFMLILLLASALQQNAGAVHICVWCARFQCHQPGQLGPPYTSSRHRVEGHDLSWERASWRRTEQWRC